MEIKSYLELQAKEIRKHTLECISTLGVGHVGGSLSIADVLAVLYFDQMNIDPKNSGKPDRDRFVLSKERILKKRPIVFGRNKKTAIFAVRKIIG